jgi:lipoprotein signal peptidase
MWGIWMAASAVLLIAAFSSPLRPVPVGLIVGGSLSQALESALRGAVTDYGRTGTGLVFNVADMALLFGAVGLLVDGLTLVGSGRLSHFFGTMS